MRAVVVGASSGLGRCVAIGLAQRGATVAMLARRLDKLESAVDEAGGDAFAVACDVTDAEGCRTAIDEAAAKLGGIDALVYTPALGPLAKLVDTSPEVWHRTFGTNVIGANSATIAALPHLRETGGRAVYFSSVSASMTDPWPGLGAYAVSKAALDKLVEAWRVEHPDVGFTRLVVGDCAGGEGDGVTQFTTEWNMDLAVELGTEWVNKGLIAGCFIDVGDLTSAVDSVIRAGSSISMPTVIVTPRPAAAVAS
jgi:NAD(P)-dependent dehydrogenase (short-subunit alcohol dehydrogenase family)